MRKLVMRKLATTSLLSVASFGTASTARNVSSVLPSNLYFLQLSAGKEIAMSNDKVHQFARQMGNYIYVIGDRDTKEAVVIDGAWDPVGIANIISRDGLNITSTIATHFHWDHIGSASKNGVRIPGLKDWVENHKVPSWVPHWELQRAAEQVEIDPSLLNALTDGQCMGIGQFGLEFIHTPGHSPGSMCIRVTDKVAGNSDEEEPSEPSDLLLITGDTVFPGSCGRLDLPESDSKIMYDSLRKLALLPDALPIYPGHSYGGSSSTIGKEKREGLLKSFSRGQWEDMMAR